MIAKALQVFRDNFLVGYDIGCTMSETVLRSSLGRAFVERACRMCVNAFHGYSHSYPCQLRFHPNGITGMGLEDLETLERIFSASNHLASVTRFASAYRRRLLIDMFYRQWDDEKYTNLALMLYNNYIQAQEIIRDIAPMVSHTLQTLGHSEDELIKFEAEERQFFATLKDEDPWDMHAIAYVEALQDLRAVTYVPFDSRIGTGRY